MDGKWIYLLGHFYNVVSLTNACRGEVLFKVSERFHSDQGSHEWKGLRECYCPPGIALKPRKSGLHLLWQRPRQLRLHQRSAPHHRDTQATRSVEKWDAIFLDALSGQTHCLCHCKVDGKLDDPEVVVIAGNLSRNAYQLFEAQMVSRFGGDPKPVPRCAPIPVDSSSADVAFECRKRIPHDSQKLRSRQYIELLLWIVKIVKVNNSEPEILSAPIDLIVQIAWGQTVSARDDIRGLHHSRAVVLAIQKPPIAFLRCGRGSIERDVAAFCANEDLFASDPATSHTCAHSSSDRTLRALTPVVDRRVQQIHASFKCGGRGGRVSRVLGVVTVAEICSQTE